MSTRSSATAKLVVALSVVTIVRSAAGDGYFPDPITADPASQYTATVGVDYNQVQRFTRTLNRPTGGPTGADLYWFKYTSDGNTRVKFDTLGSNFGTGGSGSALGSRNLSQVVVYNAAGQMKGFGRNAVGPDGYPVVAYPTYTDDASIWYYSQGLTELFFQPNPGANPRWSADPNDPNNFVDWAAPGNGSGQVYSMNEYNVWRTALDTPSWKNGNHRSVGPGAPWTRWDVLPAGDYYVAISSVAAVFAGDQRGEEYLQAPIHFDYDLLENGQRAIDGPLSTWQYYIHQGTNPFKGTINLNVSQMSLADPTWRADADGNWSGAANWDAGTPNGANVVANFGWSIAAARTVTVDADKTVGTLHFDSWHKYTLAGAGTITLQRSGGNALVRVFAGFSHEIGAGLLPASATTFDVQQATSKLTLGNLKPNAQALTKTGAGTLVLNTINAGTFAVQAGNVALSSGATAGKVAALTVAAGSKIDMGPGALAIDYGGASPLAVIRGMIIDGTIFTTVQDRLVGYGEAAAIGTTSFVNLTGLDGTTLLVRTTIAGDATLDGAVNFDDLLALAQSYGVPSGKHWNNGDSNYDGAVNFDDLLALAQNYGSQLTVVEGASAQFNADWALAQSLVPEPTALATMALVALPLAVRRRPNG